MLTPLIERACREQVVLQQPLPDDLQLLVYPHAGGVLLGLGYGPGHAHRLDLDALLRRRGGALATLGHWLPAVPAAGSCYVLRQASAEAPPAPEELAAVQEWLA